MLGVFVGDQTDQSVRQWEASRDAESSPDGAIQDWIQIVRGEYLEIPGLLLTRSQVQRFWGLDLVLCDKVLSALVEARFLRRTQGGAFGRVDGYAGLDRAPGIGVPASRSRTTEKCDAC